MAYDAFTIDTNISDRNGLQLDSGLLGQLQQFKEGNTEFVLSEIVIRELHKHLVVQVTEASEGLKSALDKAAKAQLTGTGKAEWSAKFDALPKPPVIAGNRLKAFLAATGATMIRANLASIDSLIAGYFGNEAPFEATGTKKHEFPDAIALLSLEAWAKAENKRILAVSTDKGWKAFADNSNYIDVQEDLAAALSTLQQHTEAAEKAVAKWLDVVISDEDLPESVTLNDMLSDSLSELQFFAEGHGHNCRGGESEYLQLVSYTINEDAQTYDISIVRLGSNELAAIIGITVVAIATASFSMAAWDGIDKEDVEMGYQSAQQEVEFETSMLVTFKGSIISPDDELEVIAVETLEGPDTINFGEVELDFGDDDYDDWLALNDEPSSNSDDVPTTKAP